MKNILLYGGIEENEYRSVKPLILEGNRRSMLVYTTFAVIILLIMLPMSFFVDSLVKNRMTYIGGIAGSVILLFLNLKLAKERPWILYACMYVFISIFFIFGILLGTFIEPNEVSVSFPVLLFAIPMLFSDSPLRMNIAIVLGIVAYTICAQMTQTPLMMEYNFSNILPYGALSIIVSTYMMCIKFNRFNLQQKNAFLSRSDQLTGLGNRRSYEEYMNTIRKGDCPDDLTMVVMDINGLKKVNDKLGHDAGDELIRGAAKCVSRVFEPYGVCYRTGGDEFMAILRGPVPKAEDLIAELEKQTAGWRGEYVSDLSLSIGIEAAADWPGMKADGVMHRADVAMYAYKDAYYIRTGLDRRHGK